MTTAPTLDPATLPDDPETLKKIILQYDRQLQESQQKLREREQYVLRLQHLLSQLRRWQFGTKAERIPEGQLIFPFYGTLETVPAPPEDENRAPRARRRPKRGGYRVIPKDLPQKIVVVDLPPDQKPCPDCHQERILIGYDETRQLDYHPASFFELVTRRAKYACKPCEGHLRTAPLPGPAGPIERGLPGFGLLAQVIVAKYVDHIPLYRQAGIYARQGVEIPRSTLCGWMGHGMGLLEPIVEAIARDILGGRMIRTDDTVVRLLVPGLGRTAQARLWSYLGDAHHNQVVYRFTPNRREEHPLRFLENFRGLVQADAYKGYDKLFFEGSGREELGCMAHARRYFFEARDTDPERGGTALGFIRMLYEVEASAAPMAPRSGWRCGGRSRVRSSPPSRPGWIRRRSRSCPRARSGLPSITRSPSGRRSRATWTKERRPSTITPWNGRFGGSAREEELPLRRQRRGWAMGRDGLQPCGVVQAQWRRALSVSQGRPAAGLDPSAEPDRGADAPPVEASARRLVGPTRSRPRPDSGGNPRT